MATLFYIANMTHIINVPSFANVPGKRFQAVDAILTASGAIMGATPINNGAWLLPPISNVTQYGDVPEGMGGASYNLQGGAYIQLLFTLKGTDPKTGLPNLYWRLCTKITLFAPGINGVQIAGKMLESITTSFILGLATAGIGAAVVASDTATTTAATAATEGSTVADFGDFSVGDFADSTDFSSTFDSFNFSDGEASSALTDLSNPNIDFGFTNSTDWIPPSGADDIGGMITDDPSITQFDYGATPEPSTGFGTTAADSQFTPNASTIDSVAKQGLSAAVKSAGGSSGTTTNTTATGGGTKNSQSTVSSTPSSNPTSQAGQSPNLSTAVGVLGQVESMLGITSTGQLKPNTGTSGVGTTGSSLNIYLIAGVALIAFAIIVKGGK